jgi:LPS export ABC transporter protein LptC
LTIHILHQLKIRNYSSIRIAALLVLLAACKPDGNTSEVHYEGPVMDVQNANMLYSDSARVRVHVTAPREMMLQNYDRTYPDGVFVEFFDNQGERTTTLKAKKGRFHYETNMYTVNDSVVVENIKNQETLTTQELNWRQREGKIFTEKFVTILRPDEKLTGNGLDAKQDFSWYRIRHPLGIFPVGKQDSK